MNIIDNYLNIVRYNYATFTGRARRSEYWLFTLVQVIIFGLLLFFGSAISDNNFVAAPFTIYFLATLVPTLAVAVRRLHDIGKSGTMYFVRFVPVIGIFWLIIMYCTEGEYGPNRYGPNPKNPYNEFDDIGRSQPY